MEWLFQTGKVNVDNEESNCGVQDRNMLNKGKL